MPVLAAACMPHPPILLPSVGKGEERRIAATFHACHEAAQFLAGPGPAAVVLLSPHTAAYSDWFHIAPGPGAAGSLAAFGAPETSFSVTYDEALAAAIETRAGQAGIPAGRAGERDAALDHGVMVPLWFLQHYAPAVPLVRIGLSGLPAAEHYRLGACIAEAAHALGRRISVLASGDLSHRLAENGPYGFAPEGPQLDAEITAALRSGNFGALLGISAALREAGGECGLPAFAIMAGTLDGRAVTPDLLSYEGPFGVGYAVATFRPGGPDNARRFGQRYEEQQLAEARLRRRNESPHVALARRTLENHLANPAQPPAPPAGLPPGLTQQRAGVFVTLHKHGQLRGCIGTIAPTTGSIAAEIQANAIAAASEDPRFGPVRPEELPLLTLSVDVLGESEEIASESELDPARYGVIVSAGARRGLLLPNLEGVNTAGEQIAIARRKAGIAENEPIRLERFEVTRHH